MSEKVDYKKFRQAVCHPMDRIQRIENILVIGMPDVNFCIEGCEGWIEIKSPIEPKKDSTPLFGSNHKLSQDQKNWFLSQKNAGGKGYILICTDKRWILIDGCKYADIVNEMTTRQLVDISIYSFEYLRGKVDKISAYMIREFLIGAKR